MLYSLIFFSVLSYAQVDSTKIKLELIQDPANCNHRSCYCPQKSKVLFAQVKKEIEIVKKEIASGKLSSRVEKNCRTPYVHFSKSADGKYNLQQRKSSGELQTLTASHSYSEGKFKHDRIFKDWDNPTEEHLEIYRSTFNPLFKEFELLRPSAVAGVVTITAKIIAPSGAVAEGLKAFSGESATESIPWVKWLKEKQQLKKFQEGWASFSAPEKYELLSERINQCTINNLQVEVSKNKVTFPYLTKLSIDDSGKIFYCADQYVGNVFGSSTYEHSGTIQKVILHGKKLSLEETHASSIENISSTFGKMVGGIAKDASSALLPK